MKITHRISRAASATPFFLLSICVLVFSTLELRAQSFNPQGKRDPFLNLSRILRQAQPQGTGELPPLALRPPGLAGLAISEVIVTGMAVGEESKIVLLRGVDNFTYLAREGDKLFDGHLERISAEEVVFVREITDHQGNRQTTRVVKRLYTEGS